MQTAKRHIPWFGVALIIIGIALLLDRLNVLNIEFSTIFWPIVMLFGLLRVGYGFSQNVQRRVFGGTVMFLYGLFFFLRSSDYVDLHGHIFFPATFLILGLAFFMMFLNNFKEWVFLLPAILLCGVGAAFILSEMGYLYRYDVWEAVHLYWPLGLVIIGLAIILRRRTPTQPPQVIS
jgi:hypothetical protein